MVEREKYSSENIYRIMKESAEAQSIPSSDTILHNREIFVSNVYTTAVAKYDVFTQ